MFNDILFGLKCQYDATPPMFIDVETPDVVTRGEQIGVKVTVFNNIYTEMDLEVNISTLLLKFICFNYWYECNYTNALIMPLYTSID